jgi:P pilus assembly chaperone PapD
MKRMIFAKTVAAVVMAASLPAVAQAQIVVQEVVRYIKPGQRPIENVLLRNLDEKRAFSVSAEVVKELGSGSENRTYEPTKDLVIAPPAFIMRPGENKLARMVLSKPADRDTERVYRVRFQPSQVKGEGEVEPPKGIQTQISFVTTTGMLVLVSPTNPAPKLTFTRTPTEVTFRNEGNITLDMRRNDNYCFDRDQTDCIELPGTRIYPGQAWTVPLPNRPIRYSYSVYGDISAIEIDVAK